MGCCGSAARPTDKGGSPLLGTRDLAHRVAPAVSPSDPAEESHFDVTITRHAADVPIGIAVDLWRGEVTIGEITTDGPADREGTLLPGDIIRAVEGVECSSIEQVTMCLIEGGISPRFSICRRRVLVELESEMKMKMPSGVCENGTILYR